MRAQALYVDMEMLAGRLGSVKRYDQVARPSPLGDAIWADGENRAALVGIAGSVLFEDRLRFLALELVWIRDGRFPEEVASSVVAPLYAEALRRTGAKDAGYGLNGNVWGFLAYWDQQGMDGASTLGRHVIALGKGAVPVLMPLLWDVGELVYEGSKEAVIGAKVRYRVKDVAAYLIGRILGMEMKYLGDWGERDREIAVLRVVLEGMEDGE